MIEKKGHMRNLVIILSVFNILGGIWFTGVEIMQIRNVKKINNSYREYYTDHWNYFDWVSIIVN